jgi:hypothetical protein
MSKARKNLRSTAATSSSDLAAVAQEDRSAPIDLDAAANGHAVNRSRASPRQLCCPECGASARAACDCDVAYMPAHKVAEKAVKATPHKSDRAIARDIRIDHKTVAAARKAVGENSPTKKRIGKDGKNYKATKQPSAIRVEGPTPEQSADVRKQIYADSAACAARVDPEKPAGDIADAHCVVRLLQDALISRASGSHRYDDILKP